MLKKKYFENTFFNNLAQKKRKKMSSKVPLVKVVFVGSNSSGKTTLLDVCANQLSEIRHVRQVLNNGSYIETIANQKYIIALWDTYEQEDWDRLRALSYPQTNIFMLCFDLSANWTIERLKSKFMPEVMYHSHDMPTNPLYFLIGLKNDLMAEYELWKARHTNNESDPHKIILLYFIKQEKMKNTVLSFREHIGQAYLQF